MTFTRLVQAHSRSLGSGALLLIHQSLIWPSHCPPRVTEMWEGLQGPLAQEKVGGGQAYGWPHQCKSRRGPGPPGPGGICTHGEEDCNLPSKNMTPFYAQRILVTTTAIKGVVNVREDRLRFMGGEGEC